MHFIERLTCDRALIDPLRDKEFVGYVSEDAIDVRVGGRPQARDYLAQYALAPTLLDLEGDPSREGSAHETTLACFRDPARLFRPRCRLSSGCSPWRSSSTRCARCAADR